MISIIIPNYNHAPYLNQRINSILNQTYKDFEVIILDDCSTDNSRDIIEQYRNNEKVSTIIYNSANSGNTFYQWDKGIQLAKGEYVWIAESDDWCEPTLLETIITGLENNKDAALGYCQSYCVNDDNSIRFQSNHTKLEEYVDGKFFLKNFILPRNPVFNASMAVWKKEAYLKMSKDYIEYRRIGDYLFWVELVNYGAVFISGKLLNYFRMHDRNVSANSFNSGTSFIDHIPLYKKLLERKLIDKKDFRMAMKKSYMQFRLAEKKLPKENARIIRRLFSEHAKSIGGFKLYFYLKQIQLFSKKLLRV